MQIVILFHPHGPQLNSEFLFVINVQVIFINLVFDYVINIYANYFHVCLFYCKYILFNIKFLFYLVFVVIGFHRSLGPSISKVRSISLDKWKEEWIENLVLNGNFRANQYFEKIINIKEKPSSDSSQDKKRKFIEEKYKCRSFIDLNGSNPFEEIRELRRNQKLEKPIFTSIENLKKFLKRKENPPISEQKREFGSEISELKIDGKRMKPNQIEYERKEDNKEGKNYDINTKFANIDNKKKTENCCNNVKDLDSDLEQNQFQHLSKKMRDSLLKGNPLEVLEKIEEFGNIESLI